MEVVYLREFSKILSKVIKNVNEAPLLVRREIETDGVKEYVLEAKPNLINSILKDHTFRGFGGIPTDMKRILGEQNINKMEMACVEFERLIEENEKHKTTTLRSLNETLETKKSTLSQKMEITERNMEEIENFKRILADKEEHIKHLYEKTCLLQTELKLREQSTKEMKLMFETQKKDVVYNREQRDLLAQKLRGHERKVEEVRVEIEEKITKAFCLGPLYKDYVKFENPKTVEQFEELFKHIRMDLENYMTQMKQFQLGDYSAKLGEVFEPICGLLYAMTKKGKDLNSVYAGLKVYMNSLTKKTLDEIVEEYEHVEIEANRIVKTLKHKLTEGGIYCRRVGETTEYYGLTNTVYEEREMYQEQCILLQRRIDNLVKKIKEMKKPYSKEKMEHLEKMVNEDNTTKIHDALNYHKRKLNRRETIKRIFGECEYKPGMKYAGIVISKWHYDYLSGKSLTGVLTISVEKVETQAQMRYSIKCLNKLGKVMDTRRATLWVRNVYAKKLGRQQAGYIPKTKMTQERQDERFYNTYIFRDINYEEYKENVDKVETYFKEYKQLDREVNANYISRNYSNNVGKSRSNTQWRKRNMTYAAISMKLELEKYIEMGSRSYKPKRNPVAAYRKMVDYVKKNFGNEPDLKQFRIKSALESQIAQLTYGDGEVNLSYRKFCNRAIKEYLGKPWLNDIEATSLRTLILEEKREQEKEKDEWTSSWDVTVSSDDDDSYDSYDF